MSGSRDRQKVFDLYEGFRASQRKTSRHKARSVLLMKEATVQVTIGKSLYRDTSHPPDFFEGEGAILKHHNEYAMG